MKPSTGLDPVPPRDVRADWSRDDIRPPPSILLDFMYGVTVVKHWKCDRLVDILEKRFQDDFRKVLAENPPEPEDDESGEVESDDCRKSPNYVPPRKSKQKERKTFLSEARADVLKAMNHVLLLSMWIKGTTPQSTAAEWERQHKEKELRSQEHSYEKVRQWLNSDVSVSAFI